MRARAVIVFVSALVMVVVAPVAAIAQEKERGQGPNEGEPKHEINELQNRLHQTEDKSKENHLERKIDNLQELRQEAADVAACEFPAQGVQLRREILITNTSPQIVDVETDVCGNVTGYTERMTRTTTAGPWVPR